MQPRNNPPAYIDTDDYHLFCVHDNDAFPAVNGYDIRIYQRLPDADDNTFELPPMVAYRYQCTYRLQPGLCILKLPWMLIPLYSNMRFEVEVMIEINYRDRPHQLIGPQKATIRHDQTRAMTTLPRLQRSAAGFVVNQHPDPPRYDFRAWHQHKCEVLIPDYIAHDEVLTIHSKLHWYPDWNMAGLLKVDPTTQDVIRALNWP